MIAMWTLDTIVTSAILAGIRRTAGDSRRSFTLPWMRVL